MSDSANKKPLSLYKAVRIVHSKRVSLYYRDLHDSWIVTYPVGEWVEAPHGSGLFLDKRMICYPDAEVWRVQADQVVLTAVAVRSSLLVCSATLQSFWDYFYGEEVTQRYSGNTHMRIVPCSIARRVKLLERVLSVG